LVPLWLFFFNFLPFPGKISSISDYFEHQGHLTLIFSIFSAQKINFFNSQLNKINILRDIS